MMGRSQDRFAGFFPALPLSKNIEIGEWAIGTPSAGTPWATEKFRQLTESLIEAFAKLGFKHSAMLWHRQNGFDGERPADEVYGAIQASVRFAALDSNDFTEGDDNRAYYLVTSENAELFLQPIDETSASIAHRQGGSLKSTLSIGYKIGQEAIPLPDATMPILRPFRISQRLAQTIYDHLISTLGNPSHIRTALEWHATAMANPVAVTMQQRLIAIKTGFEALLGSSKSHICAHRLRGLFENTTARHRHMLPWKGMLWSPNERIDLQRQYIRDNGTVVPVVRSELEDWFMTLAEARNSIIHDGVLSVVRYEAPIERPLSRYAGWLFWIGERLLREAIKATLGPEVLLCGLLAKREAARKFGEELIKHIKSVAQDSTDDSDKDVANAGRESNDSAGDAAARDSVADGMERRSIDAAVRESADGAVIASSRTLAELLATLGCSAANEVELSKVYGSPSASEEAARESSRRAVGYWGAACGGVEILITLAERDILRAAGAEDKLDDNFWMCD